MRALQKDDGGVTEVLGFILSFALSAVFLMISMNAFHSARENSDAVITAAELRAIADTVAARVVEAGLVGQEFPNATLNLTVSLPQDLNGHPYSVTATNSSITVTTTDGALSASSTTFKLDAVTGIWIRGSVYSTNEALVITYSRQSGAAPYVIHIHEVS